MTTDDRLVALEAFETRMRTIYNLCVCTETITLSTRCSYCKKIGCNNCVSQDSRTPDQICDDCVCFTCIPRCLGQFKCSNCNKRFCYEHITNVINPATVECSNCTTIGNITKTTAS